MQGSPNSAATASSPALTALLAATPPATTRQATGGQAPSDASSCRAPKDMVDTMVGPKHSQEFVQEETVLTMMVTCKAKSAVA
jgi:hypothetical protein